MNTSIMTGDTLDELATVAVRLGREFHQAAHSICLGGNSRDFGFVERSLNRLADRDPFDTHDDASFEAMWTCRGLMPLL